MVRPLMQSYAQNGEDVVLGRVFADQEFGFYVDIGACHPVEDSVTLHFYERGWRGVNVEPDHTLHAAFSRMRPRDTNLCAAITRTRGRVAFHPTGTRGHGTLDAALASERTCGRAVERVATIPLCDVIDCYGPDGGEIDFLKIDVEGYEAEVIASGDWARHRPRVLVIEAVDEKGFPTHEGWEPDLRAAGYRFAMFDGLNRLYCRDEDAGLLLPRLSVPANVRDGWIRARDASAHETAARLQDEYVTATRRTAEAEDRANALDADARRLRAELDAALERTESLVADWSHARTEANLAMRRSDALAVDATRARAEAAAALRREEAAEVRMAQLEMDSINLEKDIINREQDARTLRAWLAALQNSTSWRVTGPLRAVSQLLLRGSRGRG